MERFEENSEKIKFGIGEKVELLKMPDGKPISGMSKTFGEIYEVDEQNKTVKVLLLLFGTKRRSELEFKFEDIKKEVSEEK